MAETTRPGWTRWIVVRALPVVLIGALVVWGAQGVDRQGLLHAIERASPGLLLLAMLANLAAAAAQAWRWKLLLRPIGRISYPSALGAMLVGFAMSAVLPARAGELARIHVASRRMRIGHAAVVGSTVLDHIVNGIAITPLAIVLPFAPGLPAWLRAGVVALLGLALCGGSVAWLVAGSQDSAPRGAWGRFVVSLRGGFAGMRSPGLLLQALAVGVLAWGLEATTTWLALAAMGLSLSPAAAVAALIAVNVSIAIPSPAGNFGTFELGAVLALTALGVPRESAIAFALCYHMLQLASICAAGLPAWLLLRRDGTDHDPLPSVGV